MPDINDRYDDVYDNDPNEDFFDRKAYYIEMGWDFEMSYDEEYEAHLDEDQGPEFNLPDDFYSVLGDINVD